jgi:UDP-GlcNAc:undecaprenyl-phosphate GlcNAc-1-phosphate transferase|tara:strand:- start:60 stop:1106 length:1047 start_codon:yes stop_codon:yes gene_type:complete
MPEININKLYLFFIIVSLNIIFLFFFDKISKKLNFYDIPDNFRKIHTQPVSLIGGLNIFVNFIVSILCSVFLLGFKTVYINLFIFSVKSLLILFFVLFSIFLMGFLDDKYLINPIKKLAILIFLITIMCINDQTTLITYFLIPYNNINISFEQLSLIFSISCYIFLIIAINMFDGINLQSFFFFFINFFFIIINTGYPNPLIIAIIISLIPFGYLNYKNRIFLGDSGSYILAFILGYFLVKIYNNGSTYNSVDIINFLFLPIIDAIRVICQRQMKNVSMFRPDKIHIHHILLDNYKYKKTIIILLGLVLLPHFCFILNLNPFITLFVQVLLYFFIIIKKLKKISNKKI